MSQTDSNAPKMDVKVVELYVSKVIDLLTNGYTWYTKDDLGFGSIQSTLKATEQQIDMIRKHPKLKNVQTSAVLFKVIDDTVTVEPKPVTIETKQEQPVATVKEEKAPVVDTAMDAFMSM